MHLYISNYNLHKIKPHMEAKFEFDKNIQLYFIVKENVNKWD